MVAAWSTVLSDAPVANEIARLQKLTGLVWREVCAVEFLADINPHALVLCFAFQYGDRAWNRRFDKLAQPRAPIPEHLFFMNQIINNACGTIAMLHAVLNLEQLPAGADLGVMAELYRFAWRMIPSARGLCLTNHLQLLNAHNEVCQMPYAMEFDRDLELAEAERQLREVSKKGSADDDEAAAAARPDAMYHFVALVPMGGYVWLLDGMREQPLAIATIKKGEAWHAAAGRALSQIFADAGEEIRFSLLGIVDDPMVQYEGLLAIHKQRLATAREIKVQADALIAAGKSARAGYSRIAQTIQAHEDAILDLESKIRAEVADRDFAQRTVRDQSVCLLEMIHEFLTAFAREHPDDAYKTTEECIKALAEDSE